MKYENDVLAPTCFLPYPELVAGDPTPYEIIDTNEIEGLPTNGMADLENRVLYVPLDPEGRLVSRHELAHVLWSRRRPPRIRGFRGYFQATEDGRINTGLARIGLPLDLSSGQLGYVMRLGRRDLEHGAEGVIPWALRTVASFGTPAAEPLLALADLPLEEADLHRVRAIVVGVRARLEAARLRRGGPVCDFDDGLRIARWLRRSLRRLGLPEPKGDGIALCCLGRGLPGDDDRRRRGRWHGPLHGFGGGGGGRPGRMTIATPPLPLRCAPTGSRRRRRRASAEGTQLRDVSRFAHDQRVFAVRGRGGAGGGSVLIDMSGSMSLDAGDIDRLIATAPEATRVALYSGREDRGELRIVVRDGLRAGSESLSPYGGANVVDVPALEWLARQPRPRIWISDGHVTGCGDRPSPPIARRCRAICARADIRRVPDARRAVKLLASRR